MTIDSVIIGFNLFVAAFGGGTGLVLLFAGRNLCLVVHDRASNVIGALLILVSIIVIFLTLWFVPLNYNQLESNLNDHLHILPHHLGQVS